SVASCNLGRTEEFLPIGAGILLKHGEEIYERLDRVAWRAEIGLADALRTVRHEGQQSVVRDKILRYITPGDDVTNVRQKDQKIFRRQALQSDHRTAHIRRELTPYERLGVEFPGPTRQP